MADTMGVDPNKVEIVKSCLEVSFMDIRPDKLKERFVFNDGQKSYELEFTRAFIDDIPIDKLKGYLESKIVPMLKNNPGKRVLVSNGGTQVVDKKSN